LFVFECAGIDDSLRELILRLNEQFPGDVGIFSAFFLNHMKLKPGEAMFLAANLPHAYLSGGMSHMLINVVYYEYIL